MKKLLGLLGILTITSSGLSTLTNNSILLTKIENKNIKSLQNDPTIQQDINNKRLFGTNVNKLEVHYRFLAHDKLIARISHNTWKNIAFEHDTMDKQEFANQLFLLLNNFEQENYSAGGYSDKLYNSDIKIIRDMIIEHYDEFITVYEKIKDKKDLGLIMITLRDKTWSDYDSTYGVFPAENL